MIDRVLKIARRRDGSGLFALPDGFAAPGDVLVLTAHIDVHRGRCFVILKLEDWEPVRQRPLEIRKQLTETDQLEIQLTRLLIGFALDTAVDAAGKIRIPKELLEYAGVSDEVQVEKVETHLMLFHPDS
jgi:MraZ protein